MFDRVSVVRKQALPGGSISLLAKLSEALLGLSTAMLLARLLGPAHYGVYAFILSCISLASMPSRAGLPPLVVRETAKGQLVEDWAGVKGVWQWSTGIALMLALAAILIACIALSLGWPHEETSRRTLIWALALIPLMSLVAIYSACLRGLRHLAAGMLLEQVLRPALLTTILAAIFFWPSSQLSPSQAMALLVFSNGITLVLSAWLLQYYRPRMLTQTPARYHSDSWLAAAWPMAMSQGFYQVTRHADLLLLGLLTAATEVGVYVVAAQGALLTSLGLAALNTVVAPAAARLHAEKNVKELQRLVRFSAQAAVALAISVFTVFALTGEWLLINLFGKDFSAAYWPLLILAAGRAASTGFGGAGMLLNMTGSEREVTRAIATSAGLNVALNMLLIPWLGVIGAALSSSVSVIFWNAWLWRSARKRLGISTLFVSYHRDPNDKHSDQKG